MSKMGGVWTPNGRCIFEFNLSAEFHVFSRENNYSPQYATLNY